MDRSTFGRACPARVLPEMNVGTGDMLDRNQSIMLEAVMNLRTIRSMYLLVLLAIIMPLLKSGAGKGAGVRRF